MRKEERDVFRWGELGQWIGMAASVAGLVVEIVLRADLGYALVTGGSLVWAIFTKVKYWRKRKDEDRAADHRLR